MRVPDPDFKKQFRILKGKKMKIKKEELIDIYDRISLSRRSIGFIADHTDDDQVMSSLMVFDRFMQETESQLETLFKKR
jgi:hypothetical protein